MAESSTRPETGTALITGASSGIGYEFALLFARHGYDLVLVGRNRSALTALASRVGEEYGVRAEPLAKDLSVQTAPDELFAIMPPMVARELVATSGPKQNPCGFKNAFS